MTNVRAHRPNNFTFVVFAEFSKSFVRDPKRHLQLSKEVT
jgi:hypothetical protein